MPEEKISEKILEQIKNRSLKPKTKWSFRLRTYFIWFLVILLLVLSSLAFGVILYMLVNNDWSFQQRINPNLPGYILDTLPIFWLLLLGFLTLLLYFEFKSTKKGYRFTLAHILLGSVIASFALGFIFYSFGVGQVIDEELNERVPIYRNFLNPRNQIWLQPEEGFLLGEITKIVDPTMVEIIDPLNNEWVVIVNEESQMMPINLDIGMKLKIIGEIVEEGLFEAEMIMPAIPNPPFNFKGIIKPKGQFNYKYFQKKNYGGCVIIGREASAQI